MKIKLKESILDYENKPIKAPPDDEILTYFDVFINALNSNLPGEQIPAERKNQIYQISRKIYQSNEPNFTPEQLSLIKERVGKTYAPMVYGRIIDLIDGVEYPTPPPESKDESPVS